MARYRQPSNEDEFEDFCLHLLRRHWNSAQVDRLGHRGERQHGVDLIDKSGATPLRAAQCKHHMGLKTLPPAEFRAEVEKAKAFPRQLGLYVVLTTAKKSIETDLAVIDINVEHKRTGLFSVEFLTWEGIERLLDDYPEVANRLANVPAIAVLDGLAQLSAKVDDVRAALPATDFDERLDEAKSFLDDAEPAASRKLLERLREQRWQDLSPAQRSKLQVRTAGTLIAEAQYERAGHMLVEAAATLPSDEDARVHGAVGWELLNEPSKAQAIALEVLDRNPMHARAATVYIRTSSPDDDLTRVSKLAGADAPIDGELELALAQREGTARRPAEAVRRARRATVVSPEWGPAWLILGTSLINAELDRLSTAPAQPPSAQRAVLEEARDVLGKAIDRSRGRVAVQADAFSGRARARALLGDSVGAREDVEAALRLLPDHSDALLLKAGQQRDVHEELAALRQASKDGQNERAALILGIRLLEAGNESERREGSLLLGGLARRAGSPAREEAAIHAVRGFLDQNDPTAANEIATDRSLSLTPPLVSVLVARVRIHDGDLAAAEELANHALGEISGASPTGIRAIAELLGDLSRHSDAIPLWERIAPIGVPTPDTNQLILAANRAGRDDLVLRYCRALREAGHPTPRLVDLEASIMETYDREAAVELLQSYLAAHSDDRTARLRLSVLGLRLKRDDLVVSDAALLPGVDEASPSAAYFVVQSLLSGQRKSDALEYAYRFIRRNIDELDAHKLFLSAMSADRPTRGEDVPVDLPEAQAGAAVRYHEDEQDGDVWIVLEDGPDLHPEFNEFRSDTPGGKRFVGKRVGDRVLMASGIQDHWATVLEIIPKYVHRFREVVNNWHVRFPQDQSVQAFSIGEITSNNVGGGPPVFVKAVEQRAETFERAYAMYAESLMPVAALARALAMDVVSTVHGLAGASGVKCAAYDLPSERQAIAGLSAGKALVIDATAIGTILLLEIEEHLSALPVPLITTFGVSDELDRFLEENAPNGPRGTLGRSDGRLVMTSKTAEEATSAREHLSVRLAAIRKRLSLRGAQPLAHVPPAQREQLIQLYGQSGAEVLAVAADLGATLWSDDIAVTPLAVRLQVRRTWTEITMRHLAEQGTLPTELYETVAAKLVGFSYHDKKLSVLAFRGAGRMAAWNPAAFPLNGFIRSLGEPSVPPAGMIRTTAACLAVLFLEVALPETRSAVVTAMLEKLPRGPMQPNWVPSLKQATRRAFGLNALGLAEVLSLIHAWEGT